ncbi:MAG: tryptophan synthase subunit alpha, partial [Clostridiaceae bacterium]|nr:tryptophan synthase subunit alpha [Clostridiaceae bacterium]
MNRLKEVFKNKNAFIPFITAGDPNLEVTEQL